MTDRKCSACGTPEARLVQNGRETVNLEPFSGMCVDCLAKWAKGWRMDSTPALFDARAAAANDLEGDRDETA